MSGLEAISAVSAIVDPAQVGVGDTTPSAQQATSTVGFSEMLMEKLHGVDDKVEAANELVREFAVDDSVPIHQVTIALEEAKLAVELALQVRTRLVEGYRELMNMQL